MEGAACCGRAVCVAEGDYPQGFPGFHDGVGKGHVGAAGDHQLGFAVADALVAFADGGGCRGAGRHVGQAGVAEAELDRDVRGGGIAHAEHDGQRGQAVAPVLPHFPVAALPRAGTSQGRAPGYAVVGVADPLAALEACVLPGVKARGQGHLDRAVGAAGKRSAKCGVGIEGGAVDGGLGNRLGGLIGSEQAYEGFAFEEAPEEMPGVLACRADDPQTRHGDAMAGHAFRFARFFWIRR